VKKLILGVIILLLSWKLFIQDSQVEYPAGVLAKQSPIQTPPENSQPFSFEAYRIKPMADFSIKAKVLAKKSYRYGRESDLSPLDLALGWGRMSDQSVVDQIQISQSGRWYRWRVKTPPIPLSEIKTHSANMHMIPADLHVERQLERIKQGEIVQLKGHLVKVEAEDGWLWQSSMTRGDTGAHACELVYVTSVQVIPVKQ